MPAACRRLLPRRGPTVVCGEDRLCRGHASCSPAPTMAHRVALPGLALLQPMVKADRVSAPPPPARSEPRPARRHTTTQSKCAVFHVHPSSDDLPLAPSFQEAHDGFASPDLMSCLATCCCSSLPPPPCHSRIALSRPSSLRLLLRRVHHATIETSPSCPQPGHQLNLMSEQDVSPAKGNEELVRLL